jgi:hypothetical protein
MNMNRKKCMQRHMAFILCSGISAYECSRIFLSQFFPFT